MNRKRSFSLAGHRTSVAIEAAFWEELEMMAEERDLSLSGLIQQIDKQRVEDNLASACRLAVLRHLQGKRDNG